MARRRTELWTTSLLVVAAVTSAVAVYAVGSGLLPSDLGFGLDDASSWALVVLAGGLVLAFLIYVLGKERSLRRVTAMLVREQVRSASLAHRVEQISRLADLGKAAHSVLDLEDVLSLVISSALDVLGGTEGSIMLLDDFGRLEVVAYQGPSPHLVMGARVRLGEGAAGAVAARRRPMLVHGDDVVPPPPGHPERSVHSGACVPLVRRDEVLGVLVLNEMEGKRSFTESDLAALGSYAEHAAIAIGNARLFEHERETIARLEELDVLKSDFVATITHELKSPLTAIIGAARTVARKGDTLDADEHASFIQMIDRQGTRLMRLIEDVLTTSRIESGARVMKREVLELTDIARSVIAEVGQLKVGENRRVELVATPDRPRIWGDATALHQIMVNLVENALKYSDPPARVLLKVQETKEAGIVSVSDEGFGIPTEQLDVIFERFRQIDASSTRRAGGVGLGLFIVKNLVAAHGGRVDVDSEIGAGSTFTVVLPKRESDRGSMIGG